MENGSRPFVPYVRQSRARERTISLDEQLRDITGWADRMGVALTEPVIEQGVSGNKPWRERELGEAISACERGEAGGIIVSHQDRLSREDLLGTAEVWTFLERAGARLVAVAQGGDIKRMDFVIQAEIARQQWERYQQGWVKSRRQAVEKGIAGKAHVPFGFALDDERRLVPVPEEATALRKAYSMRAQGASWREVAAYLDSTGFEPRAGWAKGRDPQGHRCWIPKSVGKMLANRVYLGEVRMGEFVNSNAHPPIVTRGEWLAAQREVPGRLCRSEDGTRLAGIIFCGSCGRRMTPSVQHNSYRCLKRRDNRAPCESTAYLRMDDGDAFVVAKFVEHYRDEIGALTDEPPAKPTPDLEPLQRLLAHAEDAKRILLDDVFSLAALSSKERADVLKKVQGEVDTAREALDAALARCETSVTKVINSFGLDDLFEQESGIEDGVGRRKGSRIPKPEPEKLSGGIYALGIPEQRRLLSAGIERIEVAKGGRHDLDNRVTITWRNE